MKNQAWPHQILRVLRYDLPDFLSPKACLARCRARQKQTVQRWQESDASLKQLSTWFMTPNLIIINACYFCLVKHDVRAECGVTVVSTVVAAGRGSNFRSTCAVVKRLLWARLTSQAPRQYYCGQMAESAQHIRSKRPLKAVQTCILESQTLTWLRPGLSDRSTDLVFNKL